MNYLVLYFSGTGNTWLLAKEAEKLLKAKCYSIENAEFKDHSEKLLEEADHVILGYPIYGSEAPEPMKRFVRNLPVSKISKPISVFCTQAYASGDGANYLEEQLKSKNYFLMQSKEIKMSNNFYVPIFIRAFAVGDLEKIDKRHKKAIKRFKTFIEAIKANRQEVKRIGIINSFLGNTQRNHIGKYIKKVNEALYADDTCTKCGLCVQLCPMDNIDLKEKVVFSNRCAACMRCYQACPVSAIQITEASQDIKKYPRYKGPIEKFKFMNVQK